jgi:hypothetical protein
MKRNILRYQVSGRSKDKIPGANLFVNLFLRCHIPNLSVIPVVLQAKGIDHVFESAQLFQ